MKVLSIAVVLIVLFSSCASSRNGYGCRGNESWNHMVKRINNGY